MAIRFEVCRVEDLPVGQRKIVEVSGRSIGVFNIHGKFHAIRNVCPHQRAPLCLGKVTGTTQPGSRPGEYNWVNDGEIVRCPWHGWEFNITNGQSVFNPHRMRVKAYEVTVEGPDQTKAGCQGGCDATQTKPAQGGVGRLEEDPTLETYKVTIEQQMVVLHV